MSLITAVAGGLIIYFCRIDFVILCTILIFFFNFIPSFGSIISTAFPVLIGLMQYGFTSRIVILASGLMAMNFIFGNAEEPLFAGKKLNLSPVVILISLIFWGWLWGVVGMILAVPLTSTLKIFFENVESLQLAAAVMSAD